MNLTAADFVEELPEQPEFVKLDPTQIEDAEIVEEAKDAEDPAKIQEDFIKTIIEDFGPEQHANLIKVLEDVEKFAEESLAKSRTSILSKDDVEYKDVAIDYNNPAYSDYVKNLAIVGLLHGAGKLDDALVSRFQKARETLYRAEIYVHSVAPITQEEQDQTIHELDQRLLEGVYGMMTFQLEQVLRTLRHYYKEGQLSQETYDIYTSRASDIFNKHIEYAEFNEIDTTVLRVTYDIISEVITEYAGLLDRQ